MVIDWLIDYFIHLLTVLFINSLNNNNNNNYVAFHWTSNVIEDKCNEPCEGTCSFEGGHLYILFNLTLHYNQSLSGVLSCLWWSLGLLFIIHVTCHRCVT